MKNIKDFYIRYKEHPLYNSSEIITDDAISLIVNKMEIILFTKPGECLNDVDLGIDLEYYLWKTNVSTDYIQNTIQTQFNKYIPELSNYTYSLNLEIMQGTLADILIIKIFINDVVVNFKFQ